jgi:hypothetical protein
MSKRKIALEITLHNLRKQVEIEVLKFHVGKSTTKPFKACNQRQLRIRKLEAEILELQIQLNACQKYPQ